MKLGMQVGLDPGHIVLGEDPAPPPPNEHSPQFSAHICCGQMAAWIKMPLGMQVGLGPGDFVLDGDPAPPPQKVGKVPSKEKKFGPCLLSPNGCMDQDGTWYGGRPQPRRLCVKGGPSPLPKKGAEPPNFRPMFIAAKRLDGSRWHLYGGRPQPRQLCVRLGPSYPQKKDTPLNFWPMSIVCERLNG